MLKFNTLEEIQSWQRNGVVAGFVPDLDIDLYHHPECPGANKSLLDQVELSPAHALEYRSRKPEPKDWGDLGNAVHTAILQPELFAAKFIHLDEGVTFAMKDGKAKKEEAAEKGQICLRYQDYQDALGMVESVKRHPRARSFLYDGEAVVEGSAFWVDPDTGMLCKTRPDRLREDGIVTEIKTTVSAAPRDFAQSLRAYRYHVQGAFQLDGVRAVMNRDPKYFVIVAIEKKAPYAVNVFAIEAPAVELGRRAYKKNLATLKECQEKNHWPCTGKDYSEEILPLDLPTWVYENEE